MIAALLKAVPGIERLRLTSMDPAEVTPELVDLFKSEPRLMGHLHLSMQSGADAVLKRMARRHRQADLLRLRDRLPDIALGADLIAGFPGEGEADHQDTLALVERLGMAHLHVFPFSARPGTPAARLKRLTGDVVKARAADLRQAGARQRTRLLAGFLGKNVRVLVEEAGKGFCEAYLPVVFEGGSPGGIETVRIDKAEDDGLQGHIVS